MMIDSDVVGDVLDFSDLDNLLKLTAARAAAVQETVNMLSQILQGQKEQIKTLDKVREELSNLVICSRRVEGVATAMAAYMSSRDVSDLSKLERTLSALGDDRGCPPADSGDVHVHVKQTGGTQIGEVKAKAKRDVSLAGGDVKEGSG